MEVKLLTKINKKGFLVFCVIDTNSKETELFLKKSKLNLESIKTKTYYKLCDISKETKIHLRYKDKIDNEISNLEKILEDSYIKITETTKNINYSYPTPKKRYSCC